MDNIEEKLNILGLSEKESSIYLLLLKLKKATIIKLAKITGVKRTSVYHCIDTLIEKGLVSKLEKDTAKYYFAEDPETTLKKMMREKKESIESLIPDLKNIFGREFVQPEIRVYENEQGLRKVMEDVLSCSDKLARYYVSNYNLEDMLGREFMETFIKKRVEAGVKSLSLRPFDYKPSFEKDSTHAKQLREARFMPENMKMKPFISIYDNHVAMISTRDEKVGFIIESKEFADAQKAIFDVIWNTVAI